MRFYLWTSDHQNRIRYYRYRYTFTNIILRLESRPTVVSILQPFKSRPIIETISTPGAKSASLFIILIEYILISAERLLLTALLSIYIYTYYIYWYNTNINIFTGYFVSFMSIKLFSSLKQENTQCHTVRVHHDQ